MSIETFAIKMTAETAVSYYKITTYTE